MHNKETGGVSEDMGRFLLRVTLAVLILFHGVAKVLGGVGFIADLVVKAGMPSALAYLVYVGEVIAPLLVLFGVWTRPAALVIAVNMVVALMLVHKEQFMTVNKTGGWAIELQAIFLVSALTIALLGAGRYSAGGAGGRWN